MTWPVDLLDSLLDLLLDALGRKTSHVRCAVDYCVPCCRLYLESEASSEPKRTKSTKPILSHPFLRSSHGAHYSALKVFLSAKRICNRFLLGRISDGIDGVVPAGEVFVERRAKLHFGMPSVSAHIAAEGGHLVHYSSFIEHTYCAELDSDGDSATEQIPDLW